MTPVPHSCLPRRAPRAPGDATPGTRTAFLATAVLALSCLVTMPASAQQYSIDLSQLDPAAVLAAGNDVLLRAPDSAIDDLFQAVHASSRSDAESQALCALFHPDADRSVAGFQRTVDRLGDASRERFATAFTSVAVGGLQGQIQPYDPAAAQQVLKSAAVTATLLHEGFMVGMTTTGDDPASRDARCRSFRWMVGVVKDLPMAQRAAATRWLLQEGLTLVAAEQ
jgi:hypothetical protein